MCSRQAMEKVATAMTRHHRRAQAQRRLRRTRATVRRRLEPGAIGKTARHRATNGT
jgi:hypothetical protein